MTDTVYLNKSFNEALYLLFKQIYLSVYRVYGEEDWEPFKDYFKDKNYVYALEEVLKSRLGTGSFENSDTLTVKLSFLRKLRNKLLPGFLVTHSELGLMISTLESLRNLVNEEGFHPENIHRLRKSVPAICFDLIGSGLSSKRASKLDRIEHFNQSDFLECKSYEELTTLNVSPRGH